MPQTEKFDIAVIGAGVLGCFAARELSRYDTRVCVLERREDVCTGVSKANTGIVYSGCDTKPGTLKTRMCVRANESFDRLCAQLGVRFRRCGSIMICFGQRGREVLEKKLAQGTENGVPGLRMLSGAEVLELEGRLSPDVHSGLLSPTTGVINPWELGIAAFENARANGADFRFNCGVNDIKRSDGGFVLITEKGEIYARAVLNCAGLFADSVREMAGEPVIRIFPKRADYFVFDESMGSMVSRVIFHEPEEKGKGLTLVPTVDGNLMAGPSEKEDAAKDDFSTSRFGLDFLQRLCPRVLPGLDMGAVIRSFASLRPNPFYVSPGPDGELVREEKGISNFTLLTEDGEAPFLSLIGIKTPGVTCAHELGLYAAEKLTSALGITRLKSDFDPQRRAPISLAGAGAEARSAAIKLDSAYGRIVCRCRGVSEAEIVDAIRRGAVTVDGVKRRTGAGMGRCQGGFCGQRVLELIARETGRSVEQVCKDLPGSEQILGGGKYV